MTLKTKTLRRTLPLAAVLLATAGLGEAV